MTIWKISKINEVFTMDYKSDYNRKLVDPYDIGGGEDYIRRQERKTANAPRGR